MASRRDPHGEGRAGAPGSRNGGQAGSLGAWLETRDCPSRGTERGGMPRRSGRGGRGLSRARGALQLRCLWRIGAQGPAARASPPPPPFLD